MEQSLPKLTTVQHELFTSKWKKGKQSQPHYELFHFYTAASSNDKALLVAGSLCEKFVVKKW